MFVVKNAVRDDEATTNCKETGELAPSSSSTGPVFGFGSAVESILDISIFIFEST